LKKVYGRWDKNKIYRNDGSYITTTALNLHSEMYNKLSGLQYIQYEKGNLIVKIIKNDNFTESDYSSLLSHYKISFGIENHVVIEFVNKLDKLPNGKFQNLISKLN
jgi:phenylacetate-CoA ligase